MAGVLTHERIKKWRRSIIFGVFVFAAVVTPSPDPFMMCIMAVPTVILFEVAEFIAYVHDKRIAATDPYAGLSDDEMSPLDLDDTYDDSEPRP
jgi:sec-independent protein translocase protein TatC